MIAVLGALPFIVFGLLLAPVGILFLISRYFVRTRLAIRMTLLMVVAAMLGVMLPEWLSRELKFGHAAPWAVNLSTALAIILLFVAPAVTGWLFVLWVRSRSRNTPAVFD